MKVFISSVIGGMEDYRNAVADAISLLRHDVVRAEDFGASDASPRVACLDAVRQSDAVVLILGERYGDVQGSGFSATHEEYNEARDSRPVLVMVQDGVDFDSRQQQFRDEVQDWSSGKYTQSFRTPSELKDAVTRALYELALLQVTGSPDAGEILERALDSLEEEDGYYGTPRLAVAIASGPCQNVLRPSVLESAELKQRLLKIALFGSSPIFTYEDGTQAKIDGESLMLNQDGCSAWIQEDGTIDLVVDLRRSNTGMNAIIEEDVRGWIESFVGFAVEVLDQIDESQRLSHSVLVANLLRVGNVPWRTRQEHAASPNTITIGWGRMGNSKIEPAYLDPPDKPRSAVRASVSEVAEDLTVLLRRQLRD